MGDLAGEFQTAQTFCRETINYIRYCLKLSEADGTEPAPSSQVIDSFKVIGDAAGQSPDDRELISRLETYSRACWLNCARIVNWWLQTVRYGVWLQGVS